MTEAQIHAGNVARCNVCLGILDTFQLVKEHERNLIVKRITGYANWRGCRKNDIEKAHNFYSSLFITDYEPQQSNYEEEILP